MKRTLLQMVQSILSDMDSQDVNSISDSVEAQQIASVIEDTYYVILSSREIPELKKLIKLTSLSSLTRPTHFTYPDDVRELEKVYYETSEGNYKEIVYLEPLHFLNRQPNSGLSVPDVNANTTLLIAQDRLPSFYTSFDDKHIVMDSYDAAIESTLQESKTRAFGSVFPSFTISDSFVPQLDDNLLSYLLAESKSICFSLFKNGADPKIEQAARRIKSFATRDSYRTQQVNKRPHYGR
jgi:hypothetical protein